MRTLPRDTVLMGSRRVTSSWRGGASGPRGAGGGRAGARGGAAANEPFASRVRPAPTVLALGWRRCAGHALLRLAAGGAFTLGRPRDRDGDRPASRAPGGRKGAVGSLEDPGGGHVSRIPAAARWRDAAGGGVARG